ncbi:glycosyltransferase family 2 protein [Gloeothece verrucosa]|uniref:Glycosyl transferase family 2 n=1 Tax=Gloeothece verrucosa (strain PCC 7822) TaxID=497965 RepID=E0UJY4_GLOV7|nr:cellulose synthase catalytic subunit [Gloeothece verrucosa]ADN14620.1 glycosyl transferase family 2 [Gloeothece verrucosa PCC 7822]
MIIFYLIKKFSEKGLTFLTKFKLKAAILGVLLIGGLASSLGIEAFLETRNITHFFGLEVMEWTNLYRLWLPTFMSAIIAQIIMKISPEPKSWSRALIIIILLGITGRYLVWRATSTLNLATPLDGVFSIVIYGIELFFIFSLTVQLCLSLKIKDHSAELVPHPSPVLGKNTEFTPLVDIFIVTYNEPSFFIRRTVVGCQALDYPHKNVYVLDDGNRPEIKALARELGCDYITRLDNRYAKAGNLNNALVQTTGKLIAVFDADFVPTKNFLRRTVGFFQDEKMGLVQTNQSFYNADPVAKNLGVENILPEELENFYRYYQRLRNTVGATICNGSSFVVRRSHLEEIGGFVTESVSEDYFTGIRLTAKGYRLIYLNEKLSAGLAAENMSCYMIQRLRWCRGTLQAFFVNSNPLTIPGLLPIQRLANLEGILFWLTPIPRLILLITPFLFFVFNLEPYQVSSSDFIYFFMPYYILNILTFAWLNYHARSALISDIYSVSQCVPASIKAIEVLLNPFSERFKVTPKGISQKDFIFNAKLATPILILLGINLISFVNNFNIFFQPKLGINALLNQQFINSNILLFILTIYNLIVLAVSILIMIDAPQPDVYPSFDLQKAVKVYSDENVITGITRRISEVAAEIELPQLLKKDTLIEMEILENKLKLKARVKETVLNKNSCQTRVEWEQVSLNDYRNIVEMLFCTPNQWKLIKTPGELNCLWLLVRVLFKPKFLFKRRKS